MRRLQKIIDKLAVTLSSVLLGFVIIVLIYNVFARFLGGGISWYMEASQYINVWAVLITGISICAFGQHLRIDGLENVLKGKLKVLDKLLVALANLAFYAFFTYGSFLFASKARQSIATIPALKMSFVYWMMPVCGVLSMLSIILYTLVDLQDTLKGAEAR